MRGPPQSRAAAHSHKGAEQIDRIERYASALQRTQPWLMPSCGETKTRAANDRAELLGGTIVAIRDQVQRDIEALRIYRRTPSGKVIKP